MSNENVPVLKAFRHVETIDIKKGINGEIQDIKSLKDETDPKKMIDNLPLFNEIVDSNTPFPGVSFFTDPNFSERDFSSFEPTTLIPLDSQPPEEKKPQEEDTENKNVEKKAEAPIIDLESDFVEDEKNEEKDNKKTLSLIFQEAKTITEGEESMGSLPTLDKMIKGKNIIRQLEKDIEFGTGKTEEEKQIEEIPKEEKQIEEIPKKEKLIEEFPKVQPIINPQPNEIIPVEIKEEPINEVISNKKEIKPIIKEEIKPKNIINKVMPKEEKKENSQILPILEEEISKNPVSPKKVKKIFEEAKKKETLEDLVKSRREKIADIKKSGKLPFSSTIDEIQTKIDVNSTSESLKKLRKDNIERALTSGDRACNCCLVF